MGIIYMEASMNILKKINKMCLDRDWSIYRLSVESGVPQSTLANMFNRETLPSITTLESICVAFGITMSEFFKEEVDLKNNEAEKELLTLFRNSNESVRNSVLLILRETVKK